MWKIVFQVLAFCFLGVIGQTISRNIVSALIHQGMITNASFAAIIITAVYVLSGVLGVYIVSLIYKTKGKKKSINKTAGNKLIFIFNPQKIPADTNRIKVSYSVTYPNDKKESKTIEFKRGDELSTAIQDGIENVEFENVEFENVEFDTTSGTIEYSKGYEIELRIVPFAFSEADL
ncbi:MAG TPA: hypothetical protein IAA76_08805 [Candidatus Ornithospirochaeta stercorigallinarum]|nr:hypothetical protein [Candidatus Ornithospirochaeta stercorigallinarum]